MCDCLDCQRRTRSSFSIAAFYERDAVTARGMTRTCHQDSASGKPVTCHFWPRWGSNIYWEPRRLPELIGLAVGQWLVLLPAVPTFAVNPPPRVAGR